MRFDCLCEFHANNFIKYIVWELLVVCVWSSGGLGVSVYVDVLAIHCKLAVVLRLQRAAAPGTSWMSTTRLVIIERTRYFIIWLNCLASNRSNTSHRFTTTWQSWRPSRDKLGVKIAIAELIRFKSRSDERNPYAYCSLISYTVAPQIPPSLALWLATV